MNFPSSQVACIRQPPCMKFIDNHFPRRHARMRLDRFRWTSTNRTICSRSRCYIRRFFSRRHHSCPALIDSKFKCLLTVDRMKYVIETLFVYKMFMNYVLFHIMASHLFAHRNDFFLFFLFCTQQAASLWSMMNCIYACIWKQF